MELEVRQRDERARSMRTLTVLDDYEIRIGVESANAVVGEVVHFRTTPGGQTYYIEVGTLSVRPDPGDNDAFRPHWKVRMFLEDTYEYDPDNKVTVSPRLMERLHWQRLGIAVTTGPLPKYHPDLPDAVVRTLIGAGLCAKPVWAQVYHCRMGTVLDGYGDLSHDD